MHYMAPLNDLIQMNDFLIVYGLFAAKSQCWSSMRITLLLKVLDVEFTYSFELGATEKHF